MTIEDIAKDFASNKTNASSQRTYSNIKKMRNKVLMKSFIRALPDNKILSDNVTISGVEYEQVQGVDNLNKLWLYMQHTPKKIVWLLDDKDNIINDMLQFADILKNKVKALIIIKSNELQSNELEIVNALKNCVHVDIVGDMKNGVKLSAILACQGDKVMYTGSKQDSSCQNMTFKDMVTML